jgi:hypothetical protein
MTTLTDPLEPPLSRRLLSSARTVCDEARRDRRAVSGAVAALGAGLLLGVFLRPTVADSEPATASVAGVYHVEPGFVRTEGLDILVSARASPEGRLPRVHTRLEAPVFADPGPPPRLHRVSHIVEPDENALFEAEAEPLFIAPPALDDCGDDCDRLEDPPQALEPL